MTSMNHRHYSSRKYHHAYDDYEGLDYDGYGSYDDSDQHNSYSASGKDNWSGYDAPGRVKSKKQAMKFARRAR